MSEILAVCTAAAKEAGELLKANFGQAELEIERKPDRSLVTHLDKEAERIIINRIRQKFPGHGIIGEESGHNGSENDYIWIIDPLDGTHNFIRNINMFGVSIGIVHRGSFVAGVVYLPAFEEIYQAEQGGGAYKNGQRIRVSGYQDLAECTVTFDSSLKKAAQFRLPALQKLAEQSFSIRMFGSSARQLTYLAEGVLDAIIEFDDHSWDYAAGACILAEAGGRITNLQGGALTYKDTGFLASNGKVHQQVQEIVSSVDH
jgi:Archaeal fructose-1,6-bisphosphatase and related enzymes of inositol monophosphatase family